MRWASSRARSIRRTSFDPATDRRAFTVGMTDIGEIYFLPDLMEELAKVGTRRGR
jgi:hypothetical protein